MDPGSLDKRARTSSGNVISVLGLLLTNGLPKTLHRIPLGSGDVASVALQTNKFTAPCHVR